MSKYGELIQKARKPENQHSRNDDSLVEPPSPDIAEKANSRPEEVNLSIKVPKRLRRHWVAEAKRRDTSLTAVIITALKETLGEPPLGD